MKPNLSRVVLSLPSLVSLTTTADEPRSWIQLAKTGTFHSSRYGKFRITCDDLAQMLHNFRHVTPAAPTELPIDFDHLSMDPKQPGDGKAAGWLKRVELRAEGDELWGEVEWTPEAAGLIKNRAYRFVSPSFVKDHTYKDGTKIGTTLLAAAVTNHPFLEAMQALTLYSFSCHSARHLVGGSLDCFSCTAANRTRYGAWKRASFLNERHMLFAWTSFLTVCGADLYVRLVARGAITDLRLF